MLVMQLETHKFGYILTQLIFGGTDNYMISFTKNNTK